MSSSKVVIVAEWVLDRQEKRESEAFFYHRSYQLLANGKLLGEIDEYNEVRFYATTLPAHCCCEGHSEVFKLDGLTTLDAAKAWVESQLGAKKGKE